MLTSSGESLNAGRGVKFAKILLTSYVNAPIVIGTLDLKQFCQNLSIFADFVFLIGDGLLKVQRMGTSPFHSPKVSAHKKLSRQGPERRSTNSGTDYSGRDHIKH